MSLGLFLLKREDTFGTLSKGMKGIGNIRKTQHYWKIKDMWVMLCVSYRGLYILSTILTRKFCNYLLKVLITNVHGC